MDKKQCVFDVLGPGKSFVFGIVIGLLVLFSIGFFILLFSGDTLSITADKDGNQAYEQFNNEDADDIDDIKPNVDIGINIKPVTSEDHLNGDISKAELIVVEFSDIECPYCSKIHTTLQQVVDEYQGKIAWVYRHSPIDQLHPQSRKKSEATECAAELGGNDAFWKFVAKFYEDKSQSMEEIAAVIGLNKTAFKTCIDSDKYAEKVDSQHKDALASGGGGTPYSVILTRDGKKIPMKGALPIQKMRDLFDPLLK